MFVMNNNPINRDGEVNGRFIHTRYKHETLLHFLGFLNPYVSIERERDRLEGH